MPELTETAEARVEIDRILERRVIALEGRVEADLARGRHAELIAELEAAVAHEPLRERLRAQLMLALYRSGRQAEALEVHRDGRRVLAEQLGLEPGPALTRLERAILEHDPALEPPPAPTPPRRAVREREPGRRWPILLAAAAILLLAAAAAAVVELGGGATPAGRARDRGPELGRGDRPRERADRVADAGRGEPGQHRRRVGCGLGAQRRRPDGVAHRSERHGG